MSKKQNGSARSRKSKAAQGKAGGKSEPSKRLRPGQLDGLVLGYMKKHKGELPLTPTKVAQGIKRFSGALGRLEEAEKVRLTDKKPRSYDLAGSTK
jgi:hypothetical protein